MKSKFREKFNIPIMLIGFFLVFFIINHSNAAGLLKPVNGQQNNIKIKSHKVNVTIMNGFAKTEVDQIFENRSNQDLDATYSFPVPKDASLSELSLWINGNEVIGEVVEKKKAKKIHEEQKSKGKNTAISEKKDYKTFDVEVSPVKANNNTRIRLVYYQLINIDLNIGRYIYPLKEGGVDEEKIAFWSVDDEVTENFEFNLTLKSAFPVKDIRIPGFVNDALIKKSNTKEEEGNGETYNVAIKYNEGTSKLSKDIILYYRLDENTPARVEIIPYKENDNTKGTFMTVITPGASLQKINEGTDWVFILDISGSMTGHKITTLADGVSKVIGKMSPNDRFRIVTFNNNANDITNGFVVANPENANTWIANVKNIQANGGTALYAGLQEGYNCLDSERTTGIVLVTDGVANIGPVATKQFVNLIKKYDLRLFTFIMGNSANQPLMEKMAHETGGFAMNISHTDDIVGRLIQAKAKVLHQCMQNVKIKIKGKSVSDITPKIPKNIFMGDQLVLFGKYEKSEKITIEMKTLINGKDETFTCSAILPEIDTDNPEIERMAALCEINQKMDQIRENGETKTLKNQIIDLGVKYSLVTDYTSMLVIEESEMENLGLQRNNATRVQKERQAHQKRMNAPVKNYRVDRSNNSNSNGMFRGVRAPSVGSGPVGPLFISLLWILGKRRKEKE